jgi:hypothetical protein
MPTMSQATLAQVSIHVDHDERYPNHRQRDDEEDHACGFRCGAMQNGTNDNQEQPEAAADRPQDDSPSHPLSTLASPRRRASLASPRSSASSASTPRNWRRSSSDIGMISTSDLPTLASGRY